MYPKTAFHGRRIARSILAFAFFHLIAAAAFADCPATAGVSNVDVALIDLDDNGVPDIESKDKERNERARISSSLAAKLGVTVPAGADVFPQIRVVVDNEPLPNGEKGTGIFSVFEVFTDTADRVEVYDREDSDDEDSGYYRLFETTEVSDFTAVDVTVHAQAPSATTTTVNGGSPSLAEHFCEPHTGTFTEEVHIHTDKRFALLVPHGGGIEDNTSEQIDEIENTLAGSWDVDANTWDARGTWFGGKDESEHWHITSSEVTDDGFPGLADLLDEPQYDAQRDFQYAASLHGMKFSTHGLVIGGRAHREAKCLIAGRIRERMAADSQPLPAVYIWNYDKDFAQSIDLAHSDGTKITDPDERGSDPGVSGTSSDNIVNRLSPNSNGAAGYGGVQIEQSMTLRSTTAYRDRVAEEIANAFGELVTKPDVIDPNSTAICDALVAGDPAPTAEIHGLVWWDDDGDDAQNGGDDGVVGLTVELLDAADDVVATTVTAADGSYSFPRLADGTYRVHVAASPVLAFADQNAAGDTVDSDVDPTTGETAAIVLAAHAVVENVDAGLRLASGIGQIGDRVWLDDGVVDGLQTAGEDGVAGVEVELADENGVVIETQLTDGGGYYLFDALPDGDYVLRFTAQPGYVAAPADEEEDDSVDSDIDAAGTVAVTVSSGATDLTVDAGYRVNCEDVTLVASGSEWRYSTSLETDWTLTSFDDGGWTEKQATLGYGIAAETSITDGGTSAYFRLAFEIEDPTLFDALDLDLSYNDGAVVYLNGTEILRSNVPVTSSSDTVSTLSHTVQSPPLVEDTNVLAVELHEGDDSLFFDLEVTATICRPCTATASLALDRGTYLRDGSTTKRGSRTFIGMDANTQENGLFAWDVTGLPADAEVLHAEIELVVDDASPETFYLYPMATAWSEADAQWFQALASPSVVAWAANGANDGTTADGVYDYEGDEPLASMRFTSGMGTVPYTGVVVLNVSGRELIQSWIRGERANDGIFVPGESGSDGLDVLSDDSAQPPLLHLVYRSCSP